MVKNYAKYFRNGVKKTFFLIYVLNHIKILDCNNIASNSNNELG